MPRTNNVYIRKSAINDAGAASSLTKSWVWTSSSSRNVSYGGHLRQALKMRLTPPPSMQAVIKLLSGLKEGSRAKREQSIDMSSVQCLPGSNFDSIICGANHSYDPTVVRISNQPSVLLQALKTIEKGEINPWPTLRQQSRSRLDMRSSRMDTS
ncbi:hypothetical protein F4804DRAFT_332935 [Jackrogersella minutella]|nr:hypothetical protein F4804DRAFT_332935 [Jackrogersella minutella]